MRIASWRGRDLGVVSTETLAQVQNVNSVGGKRTVPVRSARADGSAGEPSVAAGAGRRGDRL